MLLVIISWYSHSLIILGVPCLGDQAKLFLLQPLSLSGGWLSKHAVRLRYLSQSQVPKDLQKDSTSHGTIDIFQNVHHRTPEPLVINVKSISRPRTIIITGRFNVSVCILHDIAAVCQVCCNRDTKYIRLHCTTRKIQQIITMQVGCSPFSLQLP